METKSDPPPVLSYATPQPRIKPPPYSTSLSIPLGLATTVIGLVLVLCGMCVAHQEWRYGQLDWRMGAIYFVQAIIGVIVLGYGSFVLRMYSRPLDDLPTQGFCKAVGGAIRRLRKRESYNK